MSTATLSSLFRLPWPAFAGLAALALPTTAHVVQAFGYPPCELCLKQRDAYWIAAALAGIATLLLVRRRTARLERVACVVLAVAFLAEFGLAAYHAGVEWRWWRGPVACTGGHGRLTAHDLGAALSGARIHAVSCEDAAWRLLGVSMAGWNTLISLGLVLASVFAATRVRARGFRSARHV